MYVVLTGLSIYQLSWNPIDRQLRINYGILLKCFAIRFFIYALKKRIVPREVLEYCRIQLHLSVLDHAGLFAKILCDIKLQIDVINTIANAKIVTILQYDILILPNHKLELIFSALSNFIWPLRVLNVRIKTLFCALQKKRIGWDQLLVGAFKLWQYTSPNDILHSQLLFMQCTFFFMANCQDTTFCPGGLEKDTGPRFQADGFSQTYYKALIVIKRTNKAYLECARLAKKQYDTISLNARR
ncbi:hypothetical protein PHYBLDRAFT_165576 [Phycomyces blakesleeanus NRRL 1555(-)]|uniref:Uncharacterized protein n=1 Tax=Phycomyces blakesleeanus (strain ATCC 8743b / DSM 1359 / FGSC 10004 / NBRC 33097 / NRRL 1555) TaxID=763407 RepID=A0A162UMS6_PHYB8|nr:hypothetical protein PHYBLDRAFT_165576 [Phycomyces blakesleeanus NRRL 1555(-)]OAD77082.1 hypothetical protein PHYBLDRAFT_165576 [Phycomyces blakesleeanus NRRL 1555(-)]|eukprot:XP_018295122.1 hypothetical protein PHYBLDRAFT_165576 [Phycomyces blakesleeanus NRRL 1555(-)]